MDIERFTRAFSATPSRRDIARGLSGLAIAGAVGVAAHGVSEAHKKKKKCKPCQLRQHGKCRGIKENGTTCKKTGQCDEGTCNPRPKCQAAGTEGGTCPTPGDDPRCCSRVCMPTNVCQPGVPGAPCFTDADCLTIHCVAYICREA